MIVNWLLIDQSAHTTPLVVALFSELYKATNFLLVIKHKDSSSKQQGRKSSSQQMDPQEMDVQQMDLELGLLPGEEAPKKERPGKEAPFLVHLAYEFLILATYFTNNKSYTHISIRKIATSLSN